MSLDDLVKLKNSQAEKSIPDWVSETNSSAAAYMVIQALRDERRAYIYDHVQASDFKKKANWQISIRQIAVRIDRSVQTLIGTQVKYAHDLKRYVRRINSDLSKEKDSHLAKYHRKPKSGGVRGKKKSILEEENRKLRADLEKVKAENVAKKVEMAVTQMPLDLKRKLGVV